MNEYIEQHFALDIQYEEQCRKFRNTLSLAIVNSNMAFTPAIQDTMRWMLATIVDFEHLHFPE
jgi:hypothetical protein